MSSPGAKGLLAFPLIGDLVNRVPGGSRYARIAAALLGAVVVALIVLGVVRGQRFAAWAPVEVIASHDPLQELPVRVAKRRGTIAPARTYDAVLDVRAIRSLVVGVDLDYVPKGAARYDAVIHDGAGKEHFRDEIPARYFKDGRFMLRLFAGKLRAGDYTLDIEAFYGADEGRVVASSWFQVTK